MWHHFMSTRSLQTFLRVTFPRDPRETLTHSSCRSAATCPEIGLSCKTKTVTTKKTATNDLRSGFNVHPPSKHITRRLLKEGVTTWRKLTDLDRNGTESIALLAIRGEKR